MHQFLVEPLFGTQNWSIAGYNVAFTNSAAWMCVATVALIAFMTMGTRGALIRGRGQMMVEGFVRFIDNMLAANIGPEGKRYVAYIFSLVVFILFADLLVL